jgi:hypothetical protein
MENLLVFYGDVVHDGISGLDVFYCESINIIVSDVCGGVIFSPSSWEPQEKGMMNIAARFSLSKKPRFIDPKGNKPND